MDTLLTWLIASSVLGFFLSRYWFAQKRKEASARASLQRGPLFSEGPRAQHPNIDQDACIGCGACVAACPEGDVLALIDGKASIVNGHKCIGHGLCAEECPVGAIVMATAKPSSGAELPVLKENYESSIDNLFIAGELGGLALIKNAVNQGRDCIDAIAGRIAASRAQADDPGGFDVIIVGAGPAGISASLRASEHRLKALTLERETVGGTVLKYPRQKLVMTSPVEFPLYGRFSKTALSKEELLNFWKKIMTRSDLNIHVGEGVDAVEARPGGKFCVRTQKAEYLSHAVVLALGRAGTPRKLGVKGEELSHVFYRLIEADHYTNKNILVVGGGDSAVEAAMGLAHQASNKVTLSYRRGEFSRLKDRNARRIAEHIGSQKIEVLFNSVPTEFRTGSVLIEIDGTIRELPNDFVWIFAGGSPPSDFLKQAGVAIGSSESIAADSISLVTPHVLG